ncbi:MAG TPA: peptidoglycan DD-metalloendopeptidase family protein [Herpetosiphonaceae bacterium]
MTTLHSLRRTYALTFSELAAITGVETRVLAAFEYQGYPLAPHERHAVARFFGIPDRALEGGFNARHAAEPTLSSTRARALVLVAAALTITWGLQTAQADELDPLSEAATGALSAASAYVAEVSSTIAQPNAESATADLTVDLISAPEAAQEASTLSGLPPEQPDAESPQSSSAPAETAVPETALPDQRAALSVQTPQSATDVPKAAPPAITPTAVHRATLKDAYENNYDFDHAAEIAVNVPASRLNFVCPDDGDCADNDFFKVQLTGADCYRFATTDLADGIDTNMIVFGPERTAKPALGGNDNAAPGELRSELDLCVPGRGPQTAFVLIGNHDNQRPPEPAADRFYTLQVTRLDTDSGKPQRCPLVPERGSVAVIQEWGVGTHAPAAQWGGVDLIVQGGPTAGTPIVATHAGRVQVVLNSWPGGNYVGITSDAGWRTAYAHLATVLVANGDYVEAGTIIGTVGQTGWATGPHLHYETWEHGVNVDPRPMLFCDG